MNRYELNYRKPREPWGRGALLKFRPHTWHLAFYITVFAETESRAREIASESPVDAWSMSAEDFAREEARWGVLLDKTPENWLDPEVTNCSLTMEGVEEVVGLAQKGGTQFHEVPLKIGDNTVEC